MIAALEAKMQHQQHKRADWRTRPRDYDPVTGLSFVGYLVGPFTRGLDWTPERPPSGVAKIHESRPSGGAGPMRMWFLNWLDGEKPNVPPVTCAQVRRAVDRARVRDPRRFTALDWRMEPSRPEKLTAVAFADKHKIKSSSIERWFYKAVELVVEELVADLNGQRYPE